MVPHDIEVRELGAGKSRLEVARGLDILFRVVPKLDFADGIDAARNMIPKCWFHEIKYKLGIDALRSYSKKFDEERKVFTKYPYRDWSTHGSDAFRYMAVAYQEDYEIGPIPVEEDPAVL